VKPDILLAEDERVIRRSLSAALEAAGYSVRSAEDGEKALRLYRERRPDLLLLDVMMPKMDGLSLCRKVRETDASTPVVFLTALDSEADELKGLGGGGDIYISKSVSHELMLSRISAVIRRRQREEPKGEFDIGGWRVFPTELRMCRVDGGSECRLSEREVALLRLFAMHPGEVLSRDFLISRLWGRDFEGDDNLLTVAVSRCRAKLASDGALLESARGSGYVFCTRRS
jgi:DNA-binding response OmpR family regulator